MKQGHYRRRADVICITVRYEDGTEEHLGTDEVRIGSLVQSMTTDSPGKGQQEWDTIDIHLSGPKRPVTKEQ